MTSSFPAIRFDQVAVNFGARRVLDDVSLSIDAGSINVLLGPSGSGKTTLLRTVNKMTPLAGGRVLVHGGDISQEDPVRLRRSIGYVMQASGLFPHRTVAENVTTVPRLNGVSKKLAASMAPALLSRVGLDGGLATRYPHQLSGGQQQRVGVARALASEPRVLLMDEPFAAVDPITRRSLQHEVRRINADSGATVLFVTHDVDEALTLGDRIIVMDGNGRVVQDASPFEILTAPASPFVADLIGAGDTERKLRVQQVGSSAVVTDAHGRPLGVLDQ